MTTTISPACLLLDALTAAGIRTACDFDRLEVSCNDCPLIRWIEAAEEFDRI